MKNLKKVGEIMQVYVVPYHERQPRNVLITNILKVLFCQSLSIDPPFILR